MQAYTLKTPSGIEGLTRIDATIPSPQAGEVLIKVKAIALNPVDFKVASGKALYGKIKDNDPLILGWDIAGDIITLGEGVDDFAVDEAVFGMVNFPGHGMAYAEYVVAPAKDLAKKPDNVSYQEAAAASLAALTAWQNLIDIANVSEGQRVLIHAGGGGVGHFCIQLAKERDAYVISTSSASKRDFILGLGADEHIDYDEQKFEEVIDPVDVVFESLSPEHLSRSLEVVKPGGILLTIAAGIRDELQERADKKDVKIVHHLVQSNGEQQAAIAERLADGRLKAHVSREFIFDNLPDALREVASGGTQGKIVVSV